LLAVEVLQQISKRFQPLVGAAGTDVEQVLAKIIEEVSRGGERPMRTILTDAARVNGLASEPLLLVLEDADWAMDALDVGDDKERLEAQSLWAGLSEICKAQHVAVVVTGVQVEKLQEKRIRGWHNPSGPSTSRCQCSRTRCPVNSSISWVPALNSSRHAEE
jgi:hypothetical protein